MSYLERAVSPSQISFCTNTGKETRDYTYSNFRSRTDVVDQWKKMLTPKEVEDINTIFRNEISYFSYEV